MHELVFYDEGLCNDYLLRENMFQSWKDSFYLPCKDKKLQTYKKRYSGQDFRKYYSKPQEKE